MIKKFFQSLNKKKVSYLLISGQATVLYGAATFSEDIDIWVEPHRANWERFLKVVRELGGKIYKLTPPFTMDFILRGHGFHFQFSSRKGGESTWFLDVMGVVPRVSSFSKALNNANIYTTDWGVIPVIGLRELVEIKKTRRLEDYAVISNLVKIERERLKPYPSQEDWKWILSNSFNVEDIIEFLRTSRLSIKVAKQLKRKAVTFCLKAIESQSDELILQASRQIALEIEECRQKDRLYWQPIIEELRVLKRKGRFLKEGSIPPAEVG